MVAYLWSVRLSRHQLEQISFSLRSFLCGGNWRLSSLKCHSQGRNDGGGGVYRYIYPPNQSTLNYFYVVVLSPWPRTNSISCNLYPPKSNSWLRLWPLHRIAANVCVIFFTYIFDVQLLCINASFLLLSLTSLNFDDQKIVKLVIRICFICTRYPIEDMLFVAYVLRWSVVHISWVVWDDASLFCSWM